MTQVKENNVIEAEFTEVQETPVAEVEAAAEETTEQAAAEQQTPQPVVLLGKVRMSRESVLLGSTIISHTLNLLSETGASAKFENMEQYLGYIKAKVTDVLYAVFPAGAVVEVTVVHDEEQDQINVGLKMNTESDLEVYSDRVQVVSFVKVR